MTRPDKSHPLTVGGSPFTLSSISMSLQCGFILATKDNLKHVQVHVQVKQQEHTLPHMADVSFDFKMNAT